ncbi:MAG: hypothetical protein ACFKPT_14685 [Gloeotrichia echinulata GP01]
MNKFDYVKWGFIVAVLGTIGTFLSIPDPLCKLGFNPQACPSPLKQATLVIQTETGEALPGAKIQFIAINAPEIQYTDNNGYAQVKIPSLGDVRITLSKSGYPTQDFTINLNNEQNTTRIIRINQSGQPQVQPVSTPLPTTPTITNTPTFETELNCATVYGNDIENSYNLISVGKRTEDSYSRIPLSTSQFESFTCKILKNSGEIKLAYALPDNSALNIVKLKVYVDGSLRKNIDFQRGQAIRETIDIKNASGITYDFELVSPINPDRNNVLNNVSDYVYIIK